MREERWLCRLEEVGGWMNGLVCDDVRHSHGKRS